MGATILDVKNLSNKEFVERYAKPGCIGLVGADTPIDNSIRRAQKRITKDGKASLWSHAFLFSGLRVDGQVWIIESDLEFHRKQIKLGVQENRAEKYFDDKLFPNIAVLDFGLSEEMQKKVVTEGLDLVCGNTRYSIREVFGALFTLKDKEKRKNDNMLARDNSLFCSAMVQHCYFAIDRVLNEEVSMKHLTPED